MRILLTGKNGQVGWELQRALAAVGEVIALGHSELDLACIDSISQAVRAVRPDVIVNAAAYTAVDRAEKEPRLAMLVNGIAPGILADEARRLGAVLVHYSTDYIFDGAKDGPYVEDDAAAPLNEYGRSKLAGEQAIRAAGCPHYIFRTSWVYAARGNNFVNTILRLARERAELRIVDDQVGAPTWARGIADMTAQVLVGGGASAEQARERSGVYHFTAAGAVSWCGFAQAILETAKSAFPEMNIPRLIPISSGDYPLPARRPHNSRLDNSRLSAAFGAMAPGWEGMLKECLREKAAAYSDPAAA
jgi:dTDP-4-dehydrorhamnose reductase